MDLYKLKSFYTVAKLKSFSKAAKVLCLTQPAVSTQIKELEYEYKTKLFERIGRTIQVTPAGEALIPYVKSMLDILNESRFAVNMLKKAGEGSVKLGVSELPGARLIPSCLSAFIKKYPHVDFAITAKKSSIIVELVKSKKLDLGVVGSSFTKISKPNIEGRVIYKDKIVVALSKEHPLAAKDELSVHELMDQPIIVSLRNTVSRHAIDRLFRKSGIPYKIAYEIGNKAMIKTMVEKNLGIAFFSYLDIKKEAELGWIKTMIISDYPFYRYVLAIHHRNKQLSESQKLFYNFLIENAYEN